MKVKELIRQLQKLPQDLEVCQAQDPEGNGFHFLENVALGSVDPDDMDYAGIYQVTPDLEERGYTEEDIKPTKCVILWP